MGCTVTDGASNWSWLSVVYVLPSNVSKPFDRSRMSAKSLACEVVPVIEVETPSLTTPSPQPLTLQSEMTVPVEWHVSTTPHPGAESTVLLVITLPTPD